MQRYGTFRVPAGATECGPFLRPTLRPYWPPWKLFWCIIYPDQKYIRLVEYFDVAPVAGGRHGVRAQFGFHYGETPRELDKHGCPKAISATDIRFDLSTDQYADHLHYQGENHIPQARVEGLSILRLGPFAFIEGIERHRITGDALHDCFGFTVKTR